MNKKISTMIIAALASFSLIACGSSASTDSNSSKDAKADTETADTASSDSDSSDAKDSDEAAGYCITINGTKVGVDMDMDEICSSLGKEKSKFDEPSCAGDGTSYNYDYGSYQIETYPAEDGKNRIGYITLMDDTIATDEGIDMSSSVDDIKSTYGDPKEETDDAITYEKGGMKLTFTLSDGSITSIQYISSVVG